MKHIGLFPLEGDRIMIFAPGFGSGWPGTVLRGIDEDWIIIDDHFSHRVVRIRWSAVISWYPLPDESRKGDQ